MTKSIIVALAASILCGVSSLASAESVCVPEAGEIFIDPVEYERLEIEIQTAFYDEEDRDKTIALLRPYAEAGVGVFQLTLAMVLEAGDCTDQSVCDAVAFPWYEKAARNCYTPAMETLSGTYRNGFFGQKVDLELSECWDLASIGKKSPSDCSRD